LGVGAQIKLVAGLRWRILRNSLRKKNNRMDLLGLIISATLGSIFVLGMCFAFGAGAYNFLAGGQESWIALLFWAIFLFWQGFPIMVAGFGATFEFRTLLRFPLKLGAFYTISLAYGLADVGAIASICWLISMTVGATAARPALAPVMVLAAILFVLMNVTLERLVGSWLERLLAGRRTRELFYVLFVVAMISIQFIQPAVRRYGHTALPRIRHLSPYLAVFPGSLAGRMITGAARHHFNDVWIGVGGLLLYLGVFTGFLWLRYSAQYRGEELSESVAPARVAVRSTARTQVNGDALSLLSPKIATMLRKEFHYLTRNSFAALLLIIPPVMVVFFSSQFAGRHPSVSHHAVSTDLFFPGMMAYMIFILMSPAYNCFAYEGRGIQSYFMAPVSFREILLGKNLMLVIVLALELILTIAVFNYWVGLPSTAVFIATIMAATFVVAGQLSVANWSSLSFPRKLQFGQMRGQRQSGMAVLITFGMQILLAGISAPVMFMGRWTGNSWLPAEAFAFLAAAAIGGYFASLHALTELAEKKKESLIEALCR
jgi:ABC-2 type transport system permease protein